MVEDVVIAQPPEGAEPAEDAGPGGWCLFAVQCQYSSNGARKMQALTRLEEHHGMYGVRKPASA